MKTIVRLPLLAVAIFLHTLVTTSSAQVPQLINYQGRVIVDGTNFGGAGQFKFALVNSNGIPSFWSNNGSSVNGSEPGAAIALTVANGLYSVLLGDATLANMNVIPATVFTNADVRLRVWFNGGNGFQLLTPDQRIAAVGYAMMAGNVPDGVITSAKLANGAVTSAKLADGAVTGAKLASNSVTSVQLGDTLALGATNISGRFDVYRTGAGTPAISLIGSSSQISTYGSDGLEQARLYGSSWGQLWLNNSLANNARAVDLSANGSGGGYLRLNNTNASTRAYLYGGNSGGSMTLYQADGGTGVFIDGDASGSGLINLRNTNGSTRINLYGQSPTTSSGGEISVNDNSGTETIELLGQSTATQGGKITLKQDNGTTSIVLDAEYGGNAEGGTIDMFNTLGNLGLRVEGDYLDGGRATFYNRSNKVSVDILGESGGGGYIGVRNTNNATRLGLDGQGNSGGGEIIAYANDGSIGARLYGDSGGGGYLGLYNTNSAVRLSLDGYGSSGGGQVTLYNNAGSTRVRFYGDSGGAGLGYFYNSSGSARIYLDGEDSNGDGRITTDVLEIRGGSDLSEKFDIRETESLRPGMVVSIDAESPGSLRLSAGAYDRTVAGVVSGAGGVKTGMLMGQSDTKADGKHAVALTGRVYCQVDASHGAIRPGDLLTTSDTPGHAMKVTDHARAQGAIIGKAMTSLESGQGLVLVLVSLQ